jgi:2-oxoisovalerate dehydrogenase E2 component (dihydrolipoyl transacylase)
VLWLGAEVGDTVAIGSPIVRLKVAGEGNVKEGMRLPKLRRHPPRIPPP